MRGIRPSSKALLTSDVGLVNVRAEFSGRTSEQQSLRKIHSKLSNSVCGFISLSALQKLVRLELQRGRAARSHICLPNHQVLGTFQLPVRGPCLVPKAISETLPETREE